MIGGTNGCAYAESEDIPPYRLAISPAQYGFDTVEPGETYSKTFKVKNTGSEAFDFHVSFAPYSVEDMSYEANLSKETQYTDIAKWLNIDTEDGHIEPGESIEATYSFTVPDDAHGGAQAGTILVTMNGVGGDGGGIEAVRQLGYIVYANVDGDVIKTGKVLENNIPGFLFEPPIFATSLVENTGNVYTVASYKLQVFPLFSDEEVFTNEENPDGNIVFPETKRYSEIKWEGAPQLGIFKVRQTVKIFDDENVTEKLVFLCPIWFLFVVILIIFVALFWFFSRLMKRKKEE